MNKNVFRLVYSKHLSMFVPAAETASGNAGKGSSSPARSRRRLLAVMMASSLALSASLSMADPLDALMPTGGLVPAGNPASWEGATYVKNGAVMDINQNIPKAILNWEKLNLSNGETLNFNQASASWSALNRIHSIDPSSIAGNVNALGHVYFINSNGIIFGKCAQINVGSLTASSLNLTDTLFKNGVISDPKNPTFSGTTGFVQVDAGAYLNASAGGRIMLLAPNVSSAGVINTPEGQTILAAGQKVYLSSSTDPAGLLVELDTGGTATNLGDIVSKLGNVTMVGLAVNQQGRISASTSVRANGSVMLLARDTVTVPQNQAVASRGGVLTLAKDSVTKIDVEVADKEEILTSQLTDTLGNKVLGSSKVELSGGVININGSIVANGGDVSAIAKFNPSLSTDLKNSAAEAVSATRVYLGSDASIDVSGLDATAPMSRNQLEIQLYSEQLKDTPLLRGTDFLGKTIYVDARKGTDLIAADALEAAKAIKGVTIAEVMSKAGTVKFENSLGDVILAKGSNVDVSGGTVTYESGFVRESQLLYKGNNIAISAADKNTPYEGFADVYSVTDKKWGVTRSWDLGNKYGQFYQAYANGRDAGAVNIVATNALLAADLRGFQKEGYYQRDGQVLGGSFIFTLNPAAGDSPSFRFVTDNNTILSSNFSVVGELDTASQKFGLGSSLTPGVIQVETTMFSTDITASSGGFSRFSLNALAGNIAVDAPIQLSPKGSVELQTMAQINVNASITSPGGMIAIKGGDTSLADNVNISTSGIYTNDTVGIAGATLNNVVTDAGTITIAQNDINNRGLSIGQGVRIEANAGAWLNSSKLLTGGKGGSITLTGVASLGDTVTAAYGFSKGGSLALTAYRNIQAGGQPPTQSSLNDTLWLPESFFGQGGFSQYTINTSSPGSSILIGDVAGTRTTILPQTQTLLTNAGYRSLLSGADMSIVASPILPASYLRKPASITFISVDSAGTFGKITLQENATVKLDAPNSGAGGSIVLKSNEQMTLLGSLIAPAGTISAGVISSMSQYPEYDDKLSIFVGSQALLSAKGHYAVTPSNNGLIKAAVSEGGSISLNGGDRAVVVLKEGSLLDVSGVSGEVDEALQAGYARKTLNGSAGSISITARNGMVLDGDMQASASASGAEGSLSLTFTGGDDSNKVYPNGSRTLELTSTKVARGLDIGVDSALTAVNGFGVISAQQIMDAGFGKLTLDVDRGVDGDKILIANQLNLQLQNSLILKTSLLEVANSVTANLSADYIAVGGASSVRPSSGGGELQLNGQWIDLIGDVAFAGVSATKLNAQLDIRGRGLKAATEASLSTNGALTLTGRQVYPVTNGKFRFEAIGIDSSIEIKSSGLRATEIPLSASGLLTLKADNIIQGGSLRAPLGQIVLDANKKLIFDAGSLTSVSAEGQMIPYGLTRLGGLDITEPTQQAVANENDVALKKITAKQVSISAPAVEMNVGATIDISGGGDTLAYEWIQGIGGSSDILAKVGTFAVLPNIKKGEYAPFDYNYTQPSIGINAGDSIHIAGVKGLADGDYALLPARYALLPGAYMVQTSTKAITQATSALQVDGSTLVSTYKSNGGYTDTNYSAFKITDASIFNTPKGSVSKAISEYRLTYGNQFFSKLAQDSGLAIPRISSDAGQLVIAASNNLVLGASVLTNKAETSRGGVVDITSNSIKVVGTKGDDVSGVLQLTASSLNNLNAESLLLGGTRTTSNDGSTQITAEASRLEFANNNQNALSIKELIAVSKNTLTVASGSDISTAAASGSTGNSKLKTTGTGALLAVSSLNELELERTGNTVTGDLSIAADSNILASRSMVLDSGDTANLAGTVTVSKAGSISLGAGRILLGDSGDATGLKISNSLLSSFKQLVKVTLNSKNIDIYGAVDLGGKALDLTLGDNALDLTLNAGAIAGYMTSNQTATLKANNFSLKNSLGAVNESVKNVSGTSLIVDANNIQLVGGVVNTRTAVMGFDEVQLKAANEITIAGLGTTNINATTTSLKSSRISAASAADFTIAATGVMTTALQTTQAALADASGLGAKLTMTASTLTLGGKVDLPSGQLIAKASAGDLTVSATGQLKATSVPVNFDKYTEYTPAGSITLQTTGSGNVLVGEGALVDVSGKQASDDAGGDAGTINIISKGSTTINGNLKGLASAGNKAGDFVLDTNTLPNFTSLNTALNTGGFTNLRDLRVRTGDITIAGGDAVTAKHVILSADAGKIDVFGTLDASGSKGGKIEMYARDNLSLKAGGKILAIGNDGLNAGNGGSVMMSSNAGQIKAEVFEDDGITRLANAAQIDVSGGKVGSVSGEGGVVTMLAGVTNGFGISSNLAFNPVDTAGTGRGYTANIDGFTLTAGAVVAFRPHSINTSASPTIAVSSLGANLGARPIKNGGLNLAIGDLKPNLTYVAVYDGTDFQLVSSTYLMSNPVTTAGTGSVYTATVGGFTSLTAGRVVAFTPHTTNTSTTATLNVSGLGQKAFMKNGGTVISAGDLVGGNSYFALYDGTNFQLMPQNSLVTSPITTAGSATAYTLAVGDEITLSPGTTISFTPHINSANNATLNFSDLGAKPINKQSGAIASGDLIAGKTYVAVYNGSAFLLDQTSLLANKPASTSGSNSAYTVASIDGFTSLAEGAVVAFKPHINNAANATLKVSSFTAKPIMKNGVTNVANSDLVKDTTYVAVYDGTNFQLASSDVKVSAAVGAGINVDKGTIGAVNGAREVMMDAVRVYETPSIYSSAQLQIAADTQAFSSRNSSLLNSYSQTKDHLTATFSPSVEVRSSFGALGVSSDWNLNGSLPMAGAGMLTLRALSKLDINGSINDGFAQATISGSSNNGTSDTNFAGIDAGASWSYRLVSGADFTAANTMKTIQKAGDFSLASNKFIRTGTGEINISAGGNLTMGNESSVIYTIGNAADTFSFTSPDSATFKISSSVYSTKNGITPASYLTKGGDVNINVQSDITGKVASGTSQQLISQWLFRQGGGTGNKNVSWWLRPDLFKQGVAAMGGGDVNVNAGGSITNFSVSVPTTARFNNAGAMSLNGGGDVFVKAGGDIASGIYFAGKGAIDLFAGGQITSAANNFGTTLALQDASAKVSAVKDVAIETIFNPTMWAQSSVNGGNSGAIKNGDVSYFMTYGQSSAFEISSLYGDVSFGQAPTGILNSKISSSGLTNASKAPVALEVMPSNVKAISFSGDIISGRVVLSPSANGNLNLLASRDVSTIDTSRIAISDADASTLPNVRNPMATSEFIAEAVNDLIEGHAASAVHLSDSASLVVVAKNGSISMPGASRSFGLSSPKAVDIFAGKNVSINASIQHNNSQDLSVIKAGRDVVMPSTQGSKIQVAGPGEILIEAGRNVTLGASQGIAAVANTLNPALPTQGASLTVLAGLGSEGAAVARYVASYINPNGSDPGTLLSNPSLLATYRSDTAKVVASYMRNMTGNNALSEDAAMTQYLALDLDRQSIFAYRHFSSELLASGKGYAESQNHNRGDAAIASLFPSNRIYKGDLSLYNSQIRTSRDGSVDILTPGGFINAGVPTSSGNNIGIVTERGGAIRAFAETGFQVEQSKIITQYGSDITVWVNNGDIDAGRGSKTALSVPQRVVSTNADGKTTIEAKGAAAGSGIRAQTYDPDGPTGAQIAPPLGSVALIAPRGILNASEAGIAAGNFLAVATQVLGANNISVSGTSSGVPVASTGSVAGAMTGVSNAAADATKSIASDVSRQATNNSSVKTPMPSLISVEVIGLGD